MDDGDRTAAELADELRLAIERLVDQRVPADRLARARELAASLRAELSGERRPRWYDAASPPGDPSAESRQAYVALSPIRGRWNPVAPPLVGDGWVEETGGRRVLRARATLGAAYEGPPHGVHGGWVAALFDDLLGEVQQSASQAGVTATLTVRYRHITPLDEELRLEAWIHEERGRRVVARATCHAGDTLTADAEAIFVGVDFEEVRGRMLARRSGDAPA